MKTAKEIETEISIVRKEIKDGKSIRRNKARIVFLRQCKLYIETDPSLSYLNSEVETIKFKIKVLDERYPAWCAQKNLSQWKNPLSHYRSEAGIPLLKSQLKTLKFILE